MRILGWLESVFPEYTHFDRLKKDSGLESVLFTRELIHLCVTRDVEVRGLQDQPLDTHTLTTLLENPRFRSKLAFGIAPQGRDKVQPNRPEPKGHKPAVTGGQPSKSGAEWIAAARDQHARTTSARRQDPPAALQAAGLCIEFAAKAVLSFAGEGVERHDVSEAAKRILGRLVGDDAQVPVAKNAISRILLLNRLSAPLSELTRYGFGSFSAAEVADLTLVAYWCDAVDRVLVDVTTLQNLLELGKVRLNGVDREVVAGFQAT